MYVPKLKQVRHSQNVVWHLENVGVSHAVNFVHKQTLEWKNIILKKDWISGKCLKIQNLLWRDRLGQHPANWQKQKNTHSLEKEENVEETGIIWTDWKWSKYWNRDIFMVVRLLNLLLRGKLSNVCSRRGNQPTKSWKEKFWNICLFSGTINIKR